MPFLQNQDLIKMVNDAEENTIEARQKCLNSLHYLTCLKLELLQGNMKTFMHDMSSIKVVNFEKPKRHSSILNTEEEEDDNSYIRDYIKLDLPRLKNLCTGAPSVEEALKNGKISYGPMALMTTEFYGADVALEEQGIPIGMTTDAEIRKTLNLPTFDIASISKDPAKMNDNLARVKEYQQLCQNYIDVMDELREQSSLLFNCLQNMSSSWFQNVQESLHKLVSSKGSLDKRMRNLIGQKTYSSEDMELIHNTVNMAQLIQMLIEANVVDRYGNFTIDVKRTVSMVQKKMGSEISLPTPSVQQLIFKMEEELKQTDSEYAKYIKLKEERAEKARAEAEAARRAEEAKRAEEARKAEAARRAEEAKKAEQARVLEEARRAMEAKKEEERRQAEEAKRKAEEAKQAEAARLAAEQARKEETARITAEALRRAEEKKKAEAAGAVAEQARQAEEARKAETARIAAEAVRKAEEKKQAEAAKAAAEQAKQDEQTRQAEEARREWVAAEQARQAELAAKAAAVTGQTASAGGTAGSQAEPPEKGAAGNQIMQEREPETTAAGNQIMQAEEPQETTAGNQIMQPEETEQSVAAESAGVDDRMAAEQARQAELAAKAAAFINQTPQPQADAPTPSSPSSPASDTNAGWTAAAAPNEPQTQRLPETTSETAPTPAEPEEQKPSKRKSLRKIKARKEDAEFDDRRMSDDRGDEEKRKFSLQDLADIPELPDIALWGIAVALLALGLWKIYSMSVITGIVCIAAAAVVSPLVIKDAMQIMKLGIALGLFIISFLMPNQLIPHESGDTLITVIQKMADGKGKDEVNPVEQMDLNYMGTNMPKEQFEAKYQGYQIEYKGKQGMKPEEAELVLQDFLYKKSNLFANEELIDLSNGKKDMVQYQVIHVRQPSGKKLTMFITANGKKYKVIVTKQKGDKIKLTKKKIK